MPRLPDLVEPAGSGRARPLASPRLVVIAASAGGLDAIGRVLSSLPADFPAAIAVVQHRGPEHSELLVEPLARRTWLPVRHARGGEPLQSGIVHVCPPGMHMTTQPCVRLIEGPRLDFVLPNIDLMLQSAAQVYGPRAVVVMDLAMPDLDGIAATRQIVEHAPQVRVVALSARTDAKSVVETLRAGASGYLSEQAAFGELARAIRAVTTDQFYFSADIEALASSSA
jgi:two-component system chemotaxis response regulator CheB